MINPFQNSAVFYNIIFSKYLLLLLCCISYNEVTPTPQRNVSITAVQGAMSFPYFEKKKHVKYSNQFELEHIHIHGQF